MMMICMIRIRDNDDDAWACRAFADDEVGKDLVVKIAKQKLSTKFPILSISQHTSKKTSDVAGMAFLAKKNWRKIWPKNGLK